MALTSFNRKKRVAVGAISNLHCLNILPVTNRIGTDNRGQNLDNIGQICRKIVRLCRTNKDIYRP
jgi:hypothetical protein